MASLSTTSPDRDNNVSDITTPDPQQPLVDELLQSAQFANLTTAMQSAYKSGMMDEKSYINNILQMSMTLTMEEAKSQTSQPHTTETSVADSMSRKLEYMEAQRDINNPDIQAYNNMLAKEASLQKLLRSKELLASLEKMLEAEVESHSITPVLAASAVILLGIACPKGKEESAEERIGRWFTYFLREPPETQLLRYNVFVTQGMDSADLNDWRSIITKVQVPLLPNTDRLAHFNRTLRSEAGRQVSLSGGGVPTRTVDEVGPMHRTLYKQPEPASATIFEGGGYTAAMYDTNHNLLGHVDMSEMADFMLSMNGNLATLSNQIASMQGNPKDATLGTIRHSVSQLQETMRVVFNKLGLRGASASARYVGERARGGMSRWRGRGTYRGGGESDDGQHIGGSTGSKN